MKESNGKERGREDESVKNVRRTRGYEEEGREQKKERKDECNYNKNVHVL